jgi:DNA modification methylase
MGEIDTVITSPPYLNDNVKKNSEEFWKRAKEEGKRWGSKPPSGTEDKQYSEDNISSLPLGNVDAIITSPPYTNAAAENPNVLELQKKGWVKGGDMTKFLPSNLSQENIGRLKRETYLEAMLKVYSECCKVLRPGGRIIVAVRPFIRSMKPIDLPYHTWLLLEKVGFRLEKLYKLRLKNQSFWRILYYKRHSDAPRICHEYIIVCQRAGVKRTIG